MRQKIIKGLAKLLRTEPPVKYRTKTKKVTEYIDPVDKIFELADNPNNIYVWQFKEDVPDYQLREIMGEVRDRFLNTHKREPNSLHLMLKNIKDLQRFTPEQFENQIKPYLKRSQKTNKTNN